MLFTLKIALFWVNFGLLMHDMAVAPDCSGKRFVTLGPYVNTVLENHEIWAGFGRFWPILAFK